MRWVGEWVPWVGDPQKREWLPLQGLSPRSEKSDSTSGSPAQGSHTGETVLTMLDFEGHWGLFWESQRVNETVSSLKAQFSLDQSLSRVRLIATPWTAAHQASLSITNSQSLLKPMYIF